jgi:hypothetical protein
MKAIKILGLFMLCFLFQACPEDDTPDFFVTVINNSGENVYVHFNVFDSILNVPDSFLKNSDPRGSSGLYISEKKSERIGYDFLENIEIYSFIIYKESTFEENDWETIRDEGLFDARFDLTNEELAEMDYTIEFTG